MNTTTMSSQATTQSHDETTQQPKRNSLRLRAFGEENSNATTTHKNDTPRDRVDVQSMSLFMVRDLLGAVGGETVRELNDADTAMEMLDNIIESFTPRSNDNNNNNRHPASLSRSSTPTRTITSGSIGSENGLCLEPRRAHSSASQREILSLRTKIFHAKRAAKQHGSTGDLQALHQQEEQQQQQQQQQQVVESNSPEEGRPKPIRRASHTPSRVGRPPLPATTSTNLVLGRARSRSRSLAGTMPGLPPRALTFVSRGPSLQNNNTTTSASQIKPSSSSSLQNFRLVEAESPDTTTSSNPTQSTFPEIHEVEEPVVNNTATTTDLEETPTSCDHNNTNDNNNNDNDNNLESTPTKSTHRTVIQSYATRRHSLAETRDQVELKMRLALARCNFDRLMARNDRGQTVPRDEWCRVAIELSDLLKRCRKVGGQPLAEQTSLLLAEMAHGS